MDKQATSKHSLSHTHTREHTLDPDALNARAYQPPPCARAELPPTSSTSASTATQYYVLHPAPLPAVSLRLAANGPTVKAIITHEHFSHCPLPPPAPLRCLQPRSRGYPFFQLPVGDCRARSLLARPHLALLPLPSVHVHRNLPPHGANSSNADQPNGPGHHHLQCDRWAGI